MPRRRLKRLLPIQPQKLPRPDSKGDSHLIKGTVTFADGAHELPFAKVTVPLNFPL